MTPEQEKLRDLATVRNFAEALGEHFDSVQIFATRHESGTHGGTINISYGLGNWMARYGHVAAWKIKQDEACRVEIRDELS
jgi:hypothetical protein